MKISTATQRTATATVVLGAVGWIIWTTMGRQISHAAPASSTRSSAPASVTPTLMIELTGVPDFIEFPLEEGKNRFIVAAVRGGVPTLVWAARRADSPYSFPMARCGDGRYEFNLADLRLLAALTREGENRSGQFYVFARDGASAVARSAPINFDATSLRQTMKAQYEVLCKDGEGFGDWDDPRRAATLRVTLRPVLPDSAPFVEIDARTWPMKQTAEETFTLVVTPEIRQAWEKAGAMYMRSGDTLNRRGDNQACFRVLPAQVPIPSEGHSFWITSEGYIWPKEFNDYLRFSCSAISADAATIELKVGNAASDPPVPLNGLGGCFKIGDRQCLWGVTQIDYMGKVASRAKVTIWSGVGAEKQILARLLQILPRVHSTIRFGGGEYNAQQAAQLLGELIAQSHVTTIAEFLAAVAKKENDSQSTWLIWTDTERSQPFRGWVIDWVVQTVGWDMKVSAPQ